ncbi:hypothetical protein AB0L25_23995 [Spirillospora sp. NPDC052242]
MNHPQRPSTGTAAPPEIASLEDLRALRSLDPERNPDAAEALRDVVDAEVLRDGTRSGSHRIRRLSRESA